MRKVEYLKKEIMELDDPAFADVADAITDRAVDTPVQPKDEIVHISEIADKIETVYNNWGKPSGLLSGYPSLDEKLGGFGKGHVVLIGGETSQGKSALATNIAVNISKSHGVLYITLEMLQEEVGARIKHVNDGNIDGLDLMFQSEFRLTYRDIEPTIKKARDMGNVEIVVLDYLQYLGRGMTLDEVAKMSKEIKSLALKYEIPFIVIVSLRKNEGGRNKRKWTEIEIEDFMGTAAIGYDCDTAVVASRKNIDGEWDETGIWIKVLKTRNAKLDYKNRFLRFEWDRTRITDNWDIIKPEHKKQLDQTEMTEA